MGRPAFAQIDFSGVWAPIMHEDQLERAPGPDIGDYAGLPITDAARMRALTWDASLLTLPEHQCKPHPSTYGFRGVGNLRISNDLALSDKATMEDRFYRHGDLLTHVYIISDPYYLSEPLVKTNGFRLTNQV